MFYILHISDVKFLPHLKMIGMSTQHGDILFSASIFMPKTTFMFRGVKVCSLPPLILEFYGTFVGKDTSFMDPIFLGKLHPPVGLDNRNALRGWKDHFGPKIRPVEMRCFAS